MKMHTAWLLAAWLFSFAFCGVAQAQWGPGWGGYHSSTAAEGYARGMADVVRSAGAANLMNSQAAINLEEARSQNLDNRLKYTDTYFQMRQLNRQYREKEFAAPSQEQLTRLAKQGIPDRLSPSELDPLTGEINWAFVLQADLFAPYRAPIDQLFLERASNHGHLSPEKFMQLQQAGQTLQEELRKNVRNFPSQQYMQARRFLDSLMFESSLGTG